MSEKLPEPGLARKDGGFYLGKQLKEANARLDELGSQGKRAKLKKSGASLAVQFSFEGSQYNKGIKQRFSEKGIKAAEKIAALITGQLEANTFTWDWFNSLIGKKNTSNTSDRVAAKKLLIEYRNHYFQDRKNLKRLESSWYQSSAKIEFILSDKDEPLNLKLIREIVEASENNSFARLYTIRGLRNFLDYFDISEFDSCLNQYRKNNKPKAKGKNVPSDEQISEVFFSGFKPLLRSKPEILPRLPQWQFLYGLLATYGLRVHEAWYIANWDTAVSFNNGDWITVIDAEDRDSTIRYTGKNLVIPAILDSTNQKHILCIKQAAKTGYRMALPISPSGHNWLDEFNLLQPLNLPEMRDPLRLAGKRKHCFQCTSSTCNWFRRRKYGFTPHSLRHAYNHRAHNLGYNPKDIANSLGHTLTTNQSTYLKNESITEKYRTLQLAATQTKQKQTRLELLEAENQQLKTENERLKTLLKMYQALEQK